MMIPTVADPIPDGASYNGRFAAVQAKELSPGDLFKLGTPGIRSHIWQVVKKTTNYGELHIDVAFASSNGAEGAGMALGKVTDWYPNPTSQALRLLDPIGTYDDDPNGR